MTVDPAIVELTKADLDPDTLVPTDDFVFRIDQRLARQGSTRVPGFVIVPETSHVLGTRPRFNRFIDNVLCRILSTWNESGSDAISAVEYLYASGPRVENYYRTARLAVHKSRLIGAKQTSFFLHSDYLRIQYSAISYGLSRNVVGGTLRIFDALRLQEEEGVSMMDLVTLKVPARKTRTLNDRQFYYVAKMNRINRHGAYMTTFPVISSRMPLVILSNKYPKDGLLHGPVPIRKKEPRLALRRPSYLASIATEYLTKDQMLVL